MSDVKNAIVTHISEADSSLTPKAEHVFPKWSLDVWETDTTKMPIVTVRVGPANINDVVFGRKIRSDERGTYITLFFTAHVHHTADVTGDPSKSAMDLADVIITKLLQSDDSASGIAYYDRVTYREASGMHYGLSRAIIEGYVFVKRKFS